VLCNDVVVVLRLVCVTECLVIMAWRLVVVNECFISVVGFFIVVEWIYYYCRWVFFF